MTMIYFANYGPMIQYSNGMLKISDLNPEVEIQWRMSRYEMLSMAWRSLISALKPQSHV